MLVGIDLGGTNCRAALVQTDGRIVRRQRFMTPRTSSLETLLNALLQVIDDLTEGSMPAAVGLGIPAAITDDGTISMAPNVPALNGIRLSELLQLRLGIPVRAVNDVNAIAWGEALFGAARALPSFVCIALGTGVGGALVLQRKLWTGDDGRAGEVGHVTIVPHGRRCGCGNDGCLEAYLSAEGVMATGREMGWTGAAVTATTAELAAAAIAGDQNAQAAFAQAGRQLGQALAGIVALLDPGCLLFCGGVSACLPLLRPTLDAELQLRCRTGAAASLKILTGTLGDDAGILGAVALAQELPAIP